jgi:beta-lactamase regulating signal transducer with metallopeptidase domain
LRVFVYLPFLSCVIAVGSARLVARRTEPHLSARVLTLTGLALSLATAAALSLLAFTVVARIPLVASHGRWAASAVASRVEVPTWLGVLAIVCIAAIAVRTIRIFDRYRRGLGDAVRLQLESGGEVVTISDPASFAYASRAWPFRPGVIIVSDGLQQTLDADERAAVLAHEQSHLTHQHSIYELAALLAGALNPLLRPLQREINFSLERWADEDAAAVQGRDVAASALAASALHSVGSAPRPALAHATTCVPARVEALLDSPRPRTRLLTWIAAANAIVAAVAVLLAAHSTEHIFEVLRALH